MVPDSIVLSSAGTLCVAGVAFSTLVVQLWRRKVQPEATASGWGAALAATTVIYGLAVFVQYNTPAGPSNRLSEYLQYSAFPLLVQGVYGYTFASLGLPSRRYHQVAGAFHALLLLLLWTTDLVVAPTWIERDFLLLSEAYVEPGLGPLGAPFLGYCGLAAVVSLRHWLRAGVRGRRATQTLLFGFGIWIAAALHDIVVTLGGTSVQFLMEYGFLAFSLATASAVVREIVVRQEDARIARRALEQRVALQFEGSPLGYVQWDLDLRITEWNLAAEGIFGWARAEVLGRQPYGLILPGEAQQQVDGVWAELLAGGGGQRNTNDNITRDGATIFCEWHNTPLLDPSGEVVGMASLVQDVTDRLRTEAEALEAREAAEGASRAKSQFLANMSHEIRTPMNGVMGMLDLLGNTPLDGRQRVLLDGAVRSSESMLHIIDEILDLSRIEAGRLSLEEREFDLRDVVEEAVELFAEGAHRAELGLRCAIDPDVPAAVSGDPLRLTQILANLLGNALKFTTEGGIVVQVGLERQDPERVLLRFEVRDTGIGVSRGKRKRIFEIFAQEDPTTTRRYGGSGLGLAICRQLSEHMGGTIGLSSALGEGSTFWFTASLRTIREVDPEDEAATAHLRERRVLVVADPDGAARLGARLERWGIAWEAEHASTVADRLTGDGPWDLVVVDDALAGTSGFVVARRLADLPPASRVPLLLVASVGLSMDEGRADELGVDRWLTRPVHTRDLRRSLLALLGGDAAAQADPVPRDGRERRSLQFAARVLLVEDNAVNRVVGQTMLEDVGCRVIQAHDGQEAVTRAEGEAFDLILMDCQMPVMDGYDATRAIRAGDGPNREVPIIAVTAHAMADARDACLSAGMSDFLPKPFRRLELERLLGRWLPESASLSSDGDLPFGPCLDASVLDEVLGFDSPARAPLLERLTAMCRDDGEVLVDEIKHAWAEDDLEGIRRGGHALARSTGGIGGRRLAGLASRVEQAAADGDRSTLESLVPLLKGEHHALCGALAAELSTSE